jgi:hypothetical protein
MKSKILTLSVFFYIFCVFSSCKDKCTEGVIIDNLSVNKALLVQNGRDSLTLEFDYYDSDGVLGGENSSIIILDSRTEDTVIVLPIDEQLNNASEDCLEGDISLELKSPCCDQCQSDTINKKEEFQYIVKVKDADGNESNRLESMDIELNCEYDN